jgi:uncharacterized membrane protein YidH (DUF202 family)
MPPKNTAGNARSREGKYLAHDRTVMALERTVLAYARTAFLLVTTSVTILKFLWNEPGYVIIGILLGLGAMGTFLFGLRRYISYRRKLDSVYEPGVRGSSKPHKTLMNS